MPRSRVTATLEAALEPTGRPQFGCLAGKIELASQQTAKPGLWKDLPGKFWMSADFDAPLEKFKDYME